MNRATDSLTSPGSQECSGPDRGEPDTEGEDSCPVEERSECSSNSREAQKELAQLQNSVELVELSMKVQPAQGIVASRREMLSCI